MVISTPEIHFGAKFEVWQEIFHFLKKATPWGAVFLHFRCNLCQCGLEIPVITLQICRWFLEGFINPLILSVLDFLI
mgnify:CR=1 FL=1|jgi:hypothetical protein